MLGLLFLFGISGCASYNVQSNYVPGTDFSKNKTYNWKSEAPKKIEDSRIDSAAVDSRIKNAVDSQLALKGLSTQPTQHSCTM